MIRLTPMHDENNAVMDVSDKCLKLVAAVMTLISRLFRVNFPTEHCFMRNE